MKTLRKFLFAYLLSLLHSIECGFIGQPVYYGSQRYPRHYAEHYAPQNPALINYKSYQSQVNPSNGAFPGGGTPVLASYHKRCNGNYVGLQPLPDRRQYYYVCNPDSVVFGKCGNLQTFDSNTGKCITYPQIGSAFECKREGRFPILSDCTMYYKCDRTMTPRIYSCPVGQIFNATLADCVLGEHCRSTDISPETNFSIGNCEDKFPPCQDEGIFRSPKDCSLYFKCTIQDNNNFLQTRFKCSSGKFFDMGTKMCLPQYQVECDCIPIAEWIYPRPSYQSYYSSQGYPFPAYSYVSYPIEGLQGSEFDSASNGSGGNTNASQESSSSSTSSSSSSTTQNIPLISSSSTASSATTISFPLLTSTLSSDHLSSHSSSSATNSTLTTTFDSDSSSSSAMLSTPIPSLSSSISNSFAPKAISAETTPFTDGIETTESSKSTQRTATDPDLTSTDSQTTETTTVTDQTETTIPNYVKTVEPIETPLGFKSKSEIWAQNSQKLNQTTTNTIQTNSPKTTFNDTETQNRTINKNNTKDSDYFEYSSLSKSFEETLSTHSPTQPTTGPLSPEAFITTSATPNTILTNSLYGDYNYHDGDVDFDSDEEDEGEDEDNRISSTTTSVPTSVVTPEINLLEQVAENNEYESDEILATELESTEYILPYISEKKQQNHGGVDAIEKTIFTDKLISTTSPTTVLEDSFTLRLKNLEYKSQETTTVSSRLTTTTRPIQPFAEITISKSIPTTPTTITQTTKKELNKINCTAETSTMITPSGRTSSSEGETTREIISTTKEEKEEEGSNKDYSAEVLSALLVSTIIPPLTRTPTKATYSKLAENISVTETPNNTITRQETPTPNRSSSNEENEICESLKGKETTTFATIQTDPSASIMNENYRCGTSTLASTTTRSIKALTKQPRSTTTVPPIEKALTPKAFTLKINEIEPLTSTKYKKNSTTFTTTHNPFTNATTLVTVANATMQIRSINVKDTVINDNCISAVQHSNHAADNKPRLQIRIKEDIDLLINFCPENCREKHEHKYENKNRAVEMMWIPNHSNKTFSFESGN